MHRQGAVSRWLDVSSGGVGVFSDALHERSPVRAPVSSLAVYTDLVIDCCSCCCRWPCRCLSKRCCYLEIDSFFSLLLLGSVGATVRWLCGKLSPVPPFPPSLQTERAASELPALDSATLFTHLRPLRHPPRRSHMLVAIRIHGFARRT